jgi:hypothetical protein
MEGFGRQNSLGTAPEDRFEVDLRIARLALGSMGMALVRKQQTLPVHSALAFANVTLRTLPENLEFSEAMKAPRRRSLGQDPQWGGHKGG